MLDAQCPDLESVWEQMAGAELRTDCSSHARARWWRGSTHMCAITNFMKGDSREMKGP